MPKGTLFGVGIEPTHFTSAVDALLFAIRECRLEGGGTIWIHRELCASGENSAECPCDPIPLDIEQSEKPN